MEKNQEYLNDIFIWMVEGSKKYYKEGIKIPECVVEAKQECVLNNDKLHQFLIEILIPSPGHYVKVKDLLGLYQEGGRINVSSNAVTQFCNELRQRNYSVEPKGKRGDDRAMHLKGYTIDKSNTINEDSFNAIINSMNT